MYEQIDQIIREAGKIVLGAHHISDSVREKTSRCDLVTEYDTMVQDFLYRELLAAFPEAGFYGEEGDVLEIAEKRGYFIVDPIDGTTNFIRRARHSSINVGYCLNGQMEYGAVYQPYTDELFTARRGCGAFLNGCPIHMNNLSLDESIVMYGSAIYYRQTIPLTAQLMVELLPSVLDFRRSGTAGLDLCYVAAGRADAFFECCLRPWDYAAASLIIQEAGGIVTALDGSPLRFIDRCSVAVGSPLSHPELIKLVRQVLQRPDMKGRLP